jgi:predicted RNA binding protein YcfA (HicA-like mRNA interferase family)
MKAVSGKDLCRTLERKGWVLKRIRGSHHIYVNPEGTVSTSVPVHGNRSLKTGTQRGIMRVAGLTEEDL